MIGTARTYCHPLLPSNFLCLANLRRNFTKKIFCNLINVNSETITYYSIFSLHWSNWVSSSYFRKYKAILVLHRWILLIFIWIRSQFCRIWKLPKEKGVFKHLASPVYVDYLIKKSIQFSHPYLKFGLRRKFRILLVISITAKTSKQKPYPNIVTGI